ncbi:centromere protein P-like isoform X2 [Myxocyprinus asiaticus]|uniref:centromere protein P-like isoform X2 n=1 Tax=Myxocyprinus asiaticus TaxID=70543 RepID=UPI002222F897|nr:centromere protein P-like isoform X2 [Myxocyprinus asiaticus]XP_051551405.1 centromere protein P-like isoform X2 [Myxocyprinus asiaticus]
MEQKYEEEIQMLQQEIEMLKTEREESLRSIFIQHGDRLQQELKSVCEERVGGGTQKHTLSKLIMEIRELEKDLRRQTEINGIALKECFVKTLHKSENKLVQQLRLAGHCNVLLFQVEFAVTEIQEGDALLRRVTELNIVVDGAEFKDFSSFVSSVEDTKDVLLFFRTLRMFSERCKERRETFQHFQEKYPDMVSLPEGSRSELMIIQSPKLPGISMTIFWKIDVSKEGVVKPSLELLLKMPDQAQEMDTKKVMENGSEYFESLLRILGVEASIEGLIRSMCL